MGEGEKSKGALQTVSCDHFRFLVNVDKIFDTIKVRDISCYVLERFITFNRPPDKSGYLKIILPISQSKHMLWILKRTV